MRSLYRPPVNKKIRGIITDVTEAEKKYHRIYKTVKTQELKPKQTMDIKLSLCSADKQHNFKPY